MRQRYLGAVIALSICALISTLNITGSAEQEKMPPTSRFELQYYTQGGSMSRPQNTPPSLSVSYRAETKPSAASLSFTSVAGDSQVEELGVQEERGEAKYRHFWGHGADLQLSQEPSKAEWWAYGLSAFVWSEEIAGTYLLTGDGASSSIELLPTQTKPLQPTSIAPITADPANGFAVSWSPVEGAAGYKVCARQGTYPDYTEWNNSNEDWLVFGSKESLARGILLKETHCTIPSGIFQGPVYVDIQAVSTEARGKGEVPTVFWAESNMSIEVGNDTKD